MTREVLYEHGRPQDKTLSMFRVVTLRHRVNRRTGEVTREVLYEGQSMDHPKINSLFAGRATRYAYFNGSFHVEDQSIAGPPQVCQSAGPER